MPTFLIVANCAEYPFFHRLCIYQDRAIEHLRPNSRKKNYLFSVLRLCGSRQVVAPCRADERITQIRENKKKKKKKTVRDTRVPQYQLGHEDTFSLLNVLLAFVWGYWIS